MYSSPEDQSVRIALAGVGWIVTAMLFGELVHNRRLLLEQAAERAARERAETQRKPIAESQTSGFGSRGTCTTSWPTPYRS